MVAYVTRHYAYGSEAPALGDARRPAALPVVLAEGGKCNEDKHNARPEPCGHRNTSLSVVCSTCSDLALPIHGPAIAAKYLRAASGSPTSPFFFSFFLSPFVSELPFQSLLSLPFFFVRVSTEAQRLWEGWRRSFVIRIRALM